MLEKSDIKLLKGMFETYKKDTIREMRDEMQSTVRAEGRAIRTELYRALEKTEEKILTGVAEFLDNSILSQLNQHDRRITALELKTEAT